MNCRRNKLQSEFSPAVWAHGSGPCFACVSVFREVFRNYHAFLLMYEQTGQDILRGPYGYEVSLWDFSYLVHDVLPKLPTRQEQAIRLCLIENHREMDVALMMGLSPTNPVAMYATTGIEKIIGWIGEGKLDRFGPPEFQPLVGAM